MKLSQSFQTYLFLLISTVNSLPYSLELRECLVVWRTLYPDLPLDSLQAETGAEGFGSELKWHKNGLAMESS